MTVARSDVEAAARRIAPHVRHTPVLRLPAGAAGGLGLDHPVTLKLETLQVTGSFKPRGAFNRILAAHAAPAAGVIAASGGNHGVAVAYAARTLGLVAEIFVPEATPAAKRALIGRQGARLVVGGRDYQAAFEACRHRAAGTGALLVHAYDQPEVVAGAGTLARELEADAPELTHVLVAVGGGGLLGGVLAWYADSAVEVVAVEPETCPTLAVAMLAGRPRPAPVGGIAADSLGARQIGRIGFALAARHLARGVVVADAAIAETQRRLWQACRVVAEPGGATALAALTSGAWTPPAGARVGVVVCGANADPGSLAAIPAG
ncbi:serine/threonine dehydratase [Caldovatus aquaticus]|uniref:Serine/threonine dehydratase n=1 Tax=Caldovatus aquaticus TaxID=2865671 RepID=A0ABS7F888_9PROT|nr:serine/threonine dehydratase [Caldovatus aquaticus]MBW8271177.1 serine/threonine dehydratase [Caldovatus aquaticus]